MSAQQQHDIDGAPLRTRQRVQYVGIRGDRDDARGRVSRVYRDHIRVQWDDGRTEQVHPHNVRVIPHPRGPVVL